MFVYCKKCGYITKQKQPQHSCPVCEVYMTDVPKEYLNSSKTMFASQVLRNKFEENIKQSEEFDIHIYSVRDKILSEKEAERKTEIENKVLKYNQARIKLICPICHSENISKISNVGKFVKISAFGVLGAGDIGKKYRCNSCGYRF